MKKGILSVLVLFCCASFGSCMQISVGTTVPSETTLPVQTTVPAETTVLEPTEYQFPEDADVMLRVGFNVDNMQINDFVNKATGLHVFGYQPKEGEIMGGSPLAYSLVLSTVETANVYGQCGDIVNLVDYQEMMPNFFSLFYSEEYAAYREKYMLDEDELYLAPVFTSGSTEHSVWIYREDIFRELNLEIPTDWDSFYTALKVLKAAYPESYPFAMGGVTKYFPGLVDFAQQFGVDFCEDGFAMSPDGVFYDATVTDEMREMLKKLRQLIDEGLMAELHNKDEEYWLQTLAEGSSFITYNSASSLQVIEVAGQKKNPAFYLSWFNNIPFAESELPYTTRMISLPENGWLISQFCPDIELAIHYLDWLYSEEGILTTSWGQEGISYGVKEDGSKYYLDSFIADTENKALLASPYLSGLIDFDAVLADFTPKNQEMILDTMASAKQGSFYPAPKLNHTGEEKEIVDLYLQGYLDARAAYIQNFLLGKLDVHNDDHWQKMKDALNVQGATELLNAYNSTNQKRK